MTTISLSELEQDPLGYFRRVGEGEAFVVVENDRPLAEIVPTSTPPHQQRPAGLCEGEFVTPENFDDPLPGEVQEEFES